MSAYKIIYSSVAMLLATVALASSAHAKGPLIIRHDAHVMEKEIRINLAWQSEEPIVRIIASAGKEQIVVDKNIDNERNEGGYSGEIDIVVPAYPDSTSGGQSLYVNRQNSNQFNQSSTEMHANSAAPYNQVVPYTVQLVDEVNQRSILMKDTAQRYDAGNSLPGQRLLRNDKTATPVTVMPAITPKDPLTTALNTTIGLIGKIGSNPEIKSAKVSYWNENRVSIDVTAIDDKGVDRVTFEVRDMQGNSVYQNVLSCASEKQCSKQSDPFVLNQGTYLLSAVAVDNENNNSKKYTVEFQMTSSGQQPSVQSAPVQMPTQPAELQTIPATLSPIDSPAVATPGS